MLVIDSNALIILLLGLIDKKHLGTHKTASLFDERDFEELLDFIGDLNNLLVIPNVWTEVDNLLNNFSGEEKHPYIVNLVNSIMETTEKYIKTSQVSLINEFFDIGITDALLLSLSKENEALITSDSKLSDYATAYGVLVYDMKKIKNERIRKY